MVSKLIRDFDDFIGQRRAVQLLKSQIRGAQTLGITLLNILIIGLAGMGKSSLCRSLSSALGVRILELIASRDTDEEELFEAITDLEAGDVLYIDEAHRLKPAIQDYLLAPTGEDKKVRRPRLGARGNRVGGEMISVADFTIVCATNEPGGIREALLSRLTTVIELDPYSLNEIEEIIRRLCRRTGLIISPEGVGLLACAARGNPRAASQFVEGVRRQPHCSSDGLSLRDITTFLKVYGVDPVTLLRSSERRYMLALYVRNQPYSLTHLCEMIGIDKRFAPVHVERQLLQSGYIEITSRGRRLTEAGRDVSAALEDRFPEDLPASERASRSEEEESEVY